MVPNPTKPRNTCEILNSVGMLFEVSNDVRTTSERRQRASKPRPQSFNIHFYRNSFHVSFIFLLFSFHYLVMFLSFSSHVLFIIFSCSSHVPHFSFHYPLSFLPLSFQFPSIILSECFHFPFICFLPLLPQRCSIQENIVKLNIMWSWTHGRHNLNAKSH